MKNFLLSIEPHTRQSKSTSKLNENSKLNKKFEISLSSFLYDLGKYYRFIKNNTTNSRNNIYIAPFFCSNVGKVRNFRYTLLTFT